ncbi:copper resistance CopC family protein [Phytomonospora endophytica]|uniref:CopC domain-containing protein n=1 Tax=Phytomonospora endophytica TaxID=714109 RepID=A0A841FLD9_9ACTN|nr:copper resistance CopC family protein [Phytomonospora endophytica]MBB6033439.1 hypothetical protein [Phytomonospora endophytica]GIG70788.1 copper resistance protein [Phytomonospora endophytica]
MKTVRILVTTLAVAVAALLLTAAPASAHAQLVSSDPEEGAVLDEAPAEAVLEFSERIDAPSTQIALTDATGTVVPTRAFTVDGVNLTLPLTLPAPGPYMIGYRIVSEDGHRVDGSIAFTTQKATEGAQSSASPDTSKAPGPTQAVATETADSSGGGNSTIYWILGGIVLVIAITVAVALLTRRKPAARP